MSVPAPPSIGAGAKTRQKYKTLFQIDNIFKEKFIVAEKHSFVNLPPHRYVITIQADYL